MEVASPVVDQTREDDLVVRIVTAIADAKGVEPTKLDGRLYDEVDVEALDRVFPAGTHRGHVEFEAMGVRLRLSASGELTVLG